MNDPLDDELDARLRAEFTPPAPAALTAMAQRAVGIDARRPAWPWWLAAAAVLLAAVSAFAWQRSPRGPEGHDGRELGAIFVAAFEHAVENGFGSGSCCDGGQDLGVVCEQRFAVRLGFQGKGGCSVHGCYCGLPTGGAVAVLARDGEDPVGVFVVPRGKDPRPRLPANCTLHLSRRELGPVVLYGLSSKSQSTPLQQFTLAP
jgi:hypothetical protein